MVVKNLLQWRNFMKEKNNNPIFVKNEEEKKILEFALQNYDQIILVRNLSKLNIYEKEMIILDLIEDIEPNSVFLNKNDVKKICNLFNDIVDNNNYEEFFQKLINENSGLYEQKLYNLAAKIFVKWQALHDK